LTESQSKSYIQNTEGTNFL